jgi:predicted negative regulator of RcsB-dependent stress response
MMNLIKIAIVIVLIYYAYKYYQNNISPSGKALNNSRALEIQALAEALRAKRLNYEFEKCNTLYKPLIFEWTEVARCKTLKEAQIDIGMNWNAMAKEQLGY